LVCNSTKAEVNHLNDGKSGKSIRNIVTVEILTKGGPGGYGELEKSADPENFRHEIVYDGSVIMPHEVCSNRKRVAYF
jgi:hypothetical protein